MSSAQSAWSALPTEARRELLDAVARVCDASPLAFAAPTPADMVAAIATEDIWFHAEVTFTGRCSGKIFLSIPHDLGFELFAALLHRIRSAAEHDVDMADVVGEFASKICVTWLTALGGAGSFTLSHAQVTRGGLPAPEDDNLVMSINDRPAVLRAEMTQHAAMHMPDATERLDRGAAEPAPDAIAERANQNASVATRPVTP